MLEKPRTLGMKLSEIEPCSFCKGPIAPIFYVVEIKFAIFGRGTQEVLHMAQRFSNFGQITPAALAIAEVMAPGADEAVTISEEPQTTHRLYCCQDCYVGFSRKDGKPIKMKSLAEVVEEIENEREERQTKSKTTTDASL